MAPPTTGKPPPQARGAPGRAADPSRRARRNVPRLDACLGRPPGTPGRAACRTQSEPDWRGGLPLQPLTSRARPPHPSLRGAPFPACRLPSPSSHLHTSQTQTRSLLPTNWETDLLPPPDGSTQAIIPMPPSRAAPPADRSVLGTSDQEPQGCSAHLARQAAAGGF